MPPKLAPDKILFSIPVILSLFGIVMIYSASAVLSMEHYGTPYHYLGKQLAALSAGFGLMIWAMRFDYRRLRSRWFILGPLVGVVALLMLALVTPSGPVRRRISLGFFAFQPSVFDLVYERAFLCALPRTRWSDWGRRITSLVRSGGSLAGFFYFDDNRRGPPFGIAPERLAELLERFERIEDRPATQSLGVFQGRERWQVWKRRL